MKYPGQRPSNAWYKDYLKGKRAREHKWRNRLLYATGFLALIAGGISLKRHLEKKKKTLEQDLQEEVDNTESQSKLESISSIWPGFIDTLDKLIGDNKKEDADYIEPVKRPASLYDISQHGINLIKEFEGYREQAYLCAGEKWTIGYGHTDGVKKGDKITPEKAIEYLKSDLRTAETAVQNYVKVPLTQTQYDVLVSFTYNVGAGAFKRSTLLKKLNLGDYKGASKEFERWIKANGKVLGGLIKRRTIEKDLFLKEDAA